MDKRNALPVLARALRGAWISIEMTEGGAQWNPVHQTSISGLSWDDTHTSLEVYFGAAIRVTPAGMNDWEHVVFNGGHVFQRDGGLEIRLTCTPDEPGLYRSPPPTHSGTLIFRGRLTILDQ